MEEDAGLLQETRGVQGEEEAEEEEEEEQKTAAKTAAGGRRKAKKKKRQQKTQGQHAPLFPAPVPAQAGSAASARMTMMGQEAGMMTGHGTGAAQATAARGIGSGSGIGGGGGGSGRGIGSVLGKSRRVNILLGARAAAWFASLGGFLSGYSSSMQSYMLVQKAFIRTFCAGNYGTREECSAYADEGIDTDSSMRGWTRFCTRFEGMFFLGSVIGYLLSGSLGEAVGRRRAIILMTVLFIFSTVWCVLCSSTTSIILARFFMGLTKSVTVALGPVYASEVAPTKDRGRLSSNMPLVLTMGIVTANMVAKLTSNWDQGWRYALGFVIIPAVVLLTGSVLMPESPRWLYAHNRPDEAAVALKRLRHGAVATIGAHKTSSALASRTGTGARGADGLAPADDVEKPHRSRHAPGARSARHEYDHHQDYDMEDCSDELEAIRRAVAASENQGNVLELFRQPSLRARLIICCVLMMSQQLSGAQSLLDYGAEILSAVGIRQQFLGMLLIDCVMFIGTWVALRTIDDVGRRPLLFQGYAGMIFGMLGASACVYFGSLTNGMVESSPRAYVLRYVFGACLCCFAYFFAASLGPIGWVYPPEIFPLRLRGHAMTVAAVAHGITAYFVTFSLDVIGLIGLDGFLFVLALIAIGCFAFAYLHVVESNGIPLEDMEALFRLQAGQEETKCCICCPVPMPSATSGTVFVRTRNQPSVDEVVPLATQAI